MQKLSLRILSDSKDDQRIDPPARGRIRGISAAEPKPQAIESTICDFAAVVGRATNSLRYRMFPQVARPRARKSRFMRATVRSTPAAGQARRRGVAVSRGPFGFIVGPLQLEDARVSLIRHLGQNQQVVAPKALRRPPRPGWPRSRSGS